MAVPREKTGQRKPRATAPRNQRATTAPAREQAPASGPRPVVLAPVELVPPRRRRLHLAAFAAALVYGAAAYGAYTLVAPELRDGRPSVAAAARIAPEPALAATSPEVLAMRALAARAQRGVYRLEGAGGSFGSGFVAWVQEGRKRSYLVTARAVVEGLLAEGGRTVWVRQGNRLWTGRLLRADKDAGLALVRVNAVLDKPLWQKRGHQTPLAAGDRAYLVPAGSETPFGEGVVAARPNGRLALATGSSRMYLGAPVVAGDGRIAGVVTAVHPSGVNTVVPIAAACGKVRRCR